MKKAIGYIRVSTATQAADGVSMDAQKAKIEAWCFANDYELVEVYQDAGISGTTLRGRDGLVDAMDATLKGYALVAYSMSRISRSVRDMLDIGDKLNKKDADLVSLTEKIDTTNATGKMIFNMMAVMNQFERDQCSERTAAALQHKKSKGERVGSIPHGYELDATDATRIVKNENEQSIIVTVNKLRKKGYTLRAISDALESQGVFNRNGRKFAPKSISAMIKENAA
jgi:DNA invertase Pin-like site-specific DNA recombinase